MGSELDKYPVFTEADLTDIPLMAPSVIFGVFGHRGSGKSCAAAYYGILAHKQGRRVLYFPEDYGLDCGEPLSLDDLVTFPQKMFDSMIIVDEAQILLSKFRAASYSNRIILSFTQQIRKRGASLIFTTNSPNQLDQGLADQTDFHAHCKQWEDPRCAEAGFGVHLKDCRDAILQRIADTQGKFGTSPYHRDGRRRFYRRLTRVASLYKRYNTGAIANVAEMAEMDKSRVMQAYEDDKAGQSFNGFVAALHQRIIPQLVQQGVTEIVPAVFTGILKSDLGIDASPERIGKACQLVGLERKRRSGGTRYKLPSAESLGMFLSGLGSG